MARMSSTRLGKATYKPRQCLLVLRVNGGSFEELGLELRDDLLGVRSKVDGDRVDHVGNIV
jgi:hypothetical protein